MAFFEPETDSSNAVFEIRMSDAEMSDAASPGGLRRSTRTKNVASLEASTPGTSKKRVVDDESEEGKEVSEPESNSESEDSSEEEKTTTKKRKAKGNKKASARPKKRKADVEAAKEPAEEAGEFAKPANPLVLLLQC